MSLFFKNRFRSGSPPPPFCSAVVVAAGRSIRMGSERDKIFELLDGMPVLVHTLLAFEQCPLVHEIIVVTREDSLVAASQLCHTYGISKATHVVIGGETRVASVFSGLLSVSAKAKLIAIHDGARPFATKELIASTVQAASLSGAAAPAVPLQDTIKSVSNGVFIETPDRASFRAVQTPQVFDAALIKGAIQKALEERWPITDDCSAVERIGMQVSLVEGLPENMKLTTPSDFAMAEGICQWRREKMFS
ncbi:MAG: 2-C-methyl-D-erythritol 4-phosphate cytidylyltransferase [Oscillospiraceae bacterium]|jgi:2-C-methyl-D-erythritol 4-phosphate cytidylyltransferase